MVRYFLGNYFDDKNILKNFRSPGPNFMSLCMKERKCSCFIPANLITQLTPRWIIIVHVSIYKDDVQLDNVVLYHSSLPYDCRYL